MVKKGPLATPVDAHEGDSYEPFQIRFGIGTLNRLNPGNNLAKPDRSIYDGKTCSNRECRS